MVGADPRVRPLRRGGPGFGADTQVCPYRRFGSRLHRLFRDRPKSSWGPEEPHHCQQTGSLDAQGLVVYREADHPDSSAMEG